MTTLKEFAQAFTPSATKTFNVADLPKVSTSVDILEKKAKRKDGTEFAYSYINIDGLEYRVPKTVIEQLQTILKFAPQLTHFKVNKTGTTKDDTKYKVEPVL